MIVQIIVPVAALVAISVLVAVLRAKLNIIAAEKSASNRPYLPGQKSN